MQQTVNRPRSFAFMALAFGVPMGLFFGLTKGSLEAGLVAGVAGGVLFGLGMMAFTKAASSSAALDMGGEPAGFDPEEKVLFEGLANHFKGMEGVGGKLFLTNKRVRFRSHAVNIQTHDESYPLTSITDVKAVNNAWIIPNGLLLTLADGRRERFVVYKRNEWVDQIEQRLTSRRA